MGALRRCETELELIAGAGAGRYNDWGDKNSDGPGVDLPKCETEPEARGSAGGGGKRDVI